VRLPHRPLLALAAIVAAPALTLLIVLAVWATGGPTPDAADFMAYPGVAAGTGALGLVVIVTALNGFGEEIGWRGFATDRLARRRGAFWATVVVAMMWALWHWPVFLINQTMAELIGPGLIGWVIGLFLGAFVLTDLYFLTGRSILAVALWHAAYNLAVASPGAAGLPAAVVSTVVMIWGVIAAWRLWMRGRPMQSA
jgi:membrane protease YdiL (CAAX protease family)